MQYNRQLNRDDNQDYTIPNYDHRQIWTENGFGRIDPFLTANKDLLMMIEWVDTGTQFTNTVDE